MKRFVQILLLGPFFYLFKKPLSCIALILALLLLTIVTQVGGVVLWGMLPVLDRIQMEGRLKCFAVKSGLYACAYLAVILLLVPLLAPAFGRTSLPWFSCDETPLKPCTILFGLLGRNYVKPELKTLLVHTAKRVSSRFPGSEIVYLDANFPFWDGFPLLPHLSHNDGNKVDLAYFYVAEKTGKPLESPPSPIGYWCYEQPGEGDWQPCRGQKSLLRWDFDWFQHFFSYAGLDEKRTQGLLKELIHNPQVQKIFLEPHLKKRLELNSDKIRFQGCAAARHDDHIHLQMR